MTKQILATLLVLGITTASATPAFAAGTVGKAEVIIQPEEGGSHPGLSLFLAHGFEKSAFGISAFTLMVEGWSEFLVGPTWAPTDWLELGAGIGKEQTAEGLGWRTTASLWAGKGPMSFLGIVEMSPSIFDGDDSSVWFDLAPKIELAPWLTAGMKWRRGVGVGPLAEIALPSTPAAIWLSWMPVEPEALDNTIIHPTRLLIGAQGRF